MIGRAKAAGGVVDEVVAAVRDRDRDKATAIWPGAIRHDACRHSHRAAVVLDNAELRLLITVAVQGAIRDRNRIPMVKMAPPPPTSLLLEMVEFDTVRVPPFSMPPPLLAVLSDTVLSVSERLPQQNPPPSIPATCG